MDQLSSKLIEGAGKAVKSSGPVITRKQIKEILKEELIRIKVLVYIIHVSPYISENEIISLTKFLLYFSDVTTSL